MDASGDVFIADTYNNCIREVNASSQLIATVAGNGNLPRGYGGDGGPATNALLSHPLSVVVDANGDLFIADNLNDRIREVNAGTQFISTAAGNGTVGSSGDDGPATTPNSTIPRASPWTPTETCTSPTPSISGCGNSCRQGPSALHRRPSP